MMLLEVANQRGLLAELDAEAPSKVQNFRARLVRIQPMDKMRNGEAKRPSEIEDEQTLHVATSTEGPARNSVDPHHETDS